MNPREPHTTHDAAPPGEQHSTRSVSTVPQPGDLILVERSEWYALRDGELLRVCENAGWVTPGRDIFVAPRHQVRTFWGPDYGPPDGLKPIHMSTSGGPFKSITLSLIAPLERSGSQLDVFWRWQDRPRAGGGVEYEQEVTVWKLAWLPDTETFHLSDTETGR